MIYYRKQYDKYDEEMESYIKRKIAIDLSFQSKGRWSQKDKEDIFESLMEGDVLSQHIIVNLEKVLELSELSLDKLFQ